MNTYDICFNISLGPTYTSVPSQVKDIILLASVSKATML